MDETELQEIEAYMEGEYEFENLAHCARRWLPDLIAEVRKLRIEAKAAGAVAP